MKWKTELRVIPEFHIPRCYFPKEVRIASIQLHGFSDASERAYAGVTYLCATD